MILFTTLKQQRFFIKMTKPMDYLKRGHLPEIHPVAFGEGLRHILKASVGSPWLPDLSFFFTSQNLKFLRILPIYLFMCVFVCKPGCVQDMNIEQHYLELFFAIWPGRH